MTGINSRGRTDPVVIATTSQPYDLSESILHCFSIRVMVGLPDASSRRRILGIQLKGEEVGADFNLEQVVEATEEYSGRDIKNLVLHAAIAAHDDLRARGKSSSTKGLTRILRNDHITKAKSMIPLPTKRTMSRIMDFHAQFGGMRSAHGEIPEANEVWRQDTEA
ncbi:hypothetical protein CEP54_013560 [Fusarium duplospermum]|uniref:AAA ATPase AAA+ lid domain-containing protein n=1 Tax=Fusarium duplospermum TaxID=1325734 RepID=A0A428P267_9HYPO|nr:hypothetical protein CEP54_013560 [Fusarium duplospermum]